LLVSGTIFLHLSGRAQKAPVRQKGRAQKDGVQGGWDGRAMQGVETKKGPKNQNFRFFWMLKYVKHC
jgi:hypothetical protein